jgi:hypothetical protein
MFQDPDRTGEEEVRATDLEETLAVLCAPRADDLETGDLTVPCGVVLRVLGGDTGGSTVGTTEDDWARNVAARLLFPGTLDECPVMPLECKPKWGVHHVVGLAGRVDNLIYRLHYMPFIRVAAVS